MTRAEFFGMLGAGATAPAVTAESVATPIAQSARGRSLVALSFKAPLAVGVIEHIKAQLKPYEDEFGVKFLVLCEDTSVVKLT